MKILKSFLLFILFISNGCSYAQVLPKQSLDGKAADFQGDGTIVLKLPTFSATAKMAGISRIMGGYHIQADNIAGLDLGRKVSVHIFPKIKSYFDGTAGKIDDSKATAKR